ncbi:MAG: AMP-binding protein, partial [bacterium]|nr:AMP-binding protein [bacterium]
IISDGISMALFEKELTALYELKELPPLKIQYRDYARWQNGKIRKEKIKDQEEYWLKTFAEEIPVLNLPLDYARPALQSFEGNTVPFELGKEETKALNQLAIEGNVTLYMILASIFNILLGKLSGQEDIVMGTVSAGRRHADLENIIGMFVNTLPLRNQPTGEKCFTDFLQEVKKRTLEVFENQDYQFEELMERLSVVRDTGRNPLFDVMFLIQNMETEAAGGPGLKLSRPRYETDISKVDLTLTVVEAGENLASEIEYCSKLFKEESIHRYIGYFKRIVSQVIAAPEGKISQIDILSVQEKRQVLVDFNNTSTVYPSDKNLRQLFEEQVNRTPDHIALHGVSRSSNIHLTYDQLNRKSDQSAFFLMEEGVVRGDIAAMIMERSIDMIIGILGILKAGGAYLPIDPGYPRERIDFTLADSGAKMVVTGDILNQMAGTDISKVDSSLPDMHGPEDLAYVIYTSGTTGRPKGVMVEHRQVVNLVYGLEERIYRRYRKNLNVALVAPVIFDASVQQVFGV